MSSTSFRIDTTYQKLTEHWKMKDLPEYSGKSVNQLYSYLWECNNIFKLQPTKFESDKVKICWVVQYLTEDVVNQ